MQQRTTPCKYGLKHAMLWFLTTFLCSSAYAQFSGNPIVPGDHPDPEIRYFNGRYYMYPTNEGPNEFHAYSSADLTNWQDEGAIFSLRKDCSWANVNGWAPSVIQRNNKYYLYYTAEAKIGVATSNSPTGPFVDAGQPLIGNDPYTNDIIDAMAFIDDDGQAYLYYGGSSGARMVVRKLNPNMVSFASGPSDITPPNYTEAPFLVKRDGIYYITYSNGAWYNETYNVQYATSSTPVGPWTYKGQILSSEGNIDGPGHHSILQIPGCDEYYIVYHRYNNGDRTKRTANIDRLYFDTDASIKRVVMTNSGVQARLPNGPCSAGNIISGATYKLIHKGTNQALNVANNSTAPGANVDQYNDNGNDAQRWIVTREEDGHYKFRHKNTNQCLDVSGNSSAPSTNVIQYTDNGNDAQRWWMEAMSGGYHKLKHKNTDQCLDAANNSAGPANVIQYTDNGNNAQRWKLQLIAMPAIVSGGIYELEPKCAPGKRLDVAGAQDANGVNVLIYQQNNNAAQKWRINDVGYGLYELVPQCAPTRRLDVAGGSSNNGTNIGIYQSNANIAQRFRILDQGNGYYELEPACAPGKRLDVSGMRYQNATNIHVWQDYSNDAQRFRLILQPASNANLAEASSHQLITEKKASHPFPNPFQREVTFPAHLHAKGTVEVKIFDAAGKLIRTLRFNNLTEGDHQLTWDGKSAQGTSLRQGLYMYETKANGKTSKGKIINQY